MTDQPGAPGEFPRKSGDGSGSGRYYRVEARYNSRGQARIVNGIALGPNWVTLEFPDSPVKGLGVPRRHYDFGIPPESSLLEYASAQALRWWFLANAGPLGGLCIETRLVRYEHKYSYTSTAVEAVEYTDQGMRPVADPPGEEPANG